MAQAGPSQAWAAPRAEAAPCTFHTAPSFSTLGLRGDPPGTPHGVPPHDSGGTCCRQAAAPHCPGRGRHPCPRTRLPASSAAPRSCAQGMTPHPPPPPDGAARWAAARRAGAPLGGARGAGLHTSNTCVPGSPALARHVGCNAVCWEHRLPPHDRTSSRPSNRPCPSCKDPPGLTGRSPQASPRGLGLPDLAFGPRSLDQTRACCTPPALPRPAVERAPPPRKRGPAAGCAQPAPRPCGPHAAPPHSLPLRRRGAGPGRS